MGDVRLTGNFLATARCLIFADSASGVWSFDPNTNTLTITAAGGGTAFANPTAKVGLTAVNGGATTMMRSDGAPPIDQGITPTWTGAHKFNAGLGLNGKTAPAQVTGWGTPTNQAVVANYNATTATLLQTADVVAQLITDLKAFGLYGA